MLPLEIADPAYYFSSILYRSDQLTEDQIKNLFIEEGVTSFKLFQHDFFPMKRYYSKEMGDEKLLKRFFLVDLNKQSRDVFKNKKIWAYEREKEFLQEGKRLVNIDIGMITVENLQLATTKKFSHRIYLGGGIYSDLTFIFREGHFQCLPWTYPDYAHEEIRGFFREMRNVLLDDLRGSKE